MVDCFEAWPKMPHLRSFFLDTFGMDPEGNCDRNRYYPLRRFIKNCSALQQLTVLSVGVTQLQLQSIVKGLAHLKDLDVKLPSAVDKTEILDLLAKFCHELRFINVTHWTNFSSDWLAQMFECIPTLRRLSYKVREPHCRRRRGGEVSFHFAPEMRVLGDFSSRDVYRYSMSKCEAKRIHLE